MDRTYYNPTPEQRREVQETQARLRAALLINRARRPLVASAPAKPVQVVIGSRVL